MYKILIVDSNILFREGLTNLLCQEPGIAVVGEASTIADAIEIVGTLSPDLVLVDAGLPDLNDVSGPGSAANLKELGRKSGLRVLRMLNPRMQVALLSAAVSEDQLMHAVRNGARGYLPKDHNMPSFMASIRALERGEAVVPPAMVGALLDTLARITEPNEQDGLSALTRREIDVLCELGRGLTNQQIAEQLDIAENTVKVHVHNILEKLNMRNRQQAARYARTQGMVSTKVYKSYPSPERAKVLTNRIEINETLTRMTDSVSAIFKSTSKPR